MYAGGHFIESRPRVIFEHPTLTVPFADRAEFLDFLFRARSLNPTRLIDFRVSSRELRRVVCTSVRNSTPVLRETGDLSNLPPTDDSTVVIHL